MSGDRTARAVELARVLRHFGSTRAVDGVDLAIEPGEFFAMLGPSGSGKTTCLRLIAGFDRPDSGDIFVFGQRVTDAPPYRRPVSTVFQDYALFPHMSVGENVAYGLRIRGMSRIDRERRARDMLALVRLTGLEERRPGQLSGGQKQRVALARALAVEPKVLLLDEPLGALDLGLRESMQAELKMLHRKLGLTFVYVTHDQGEALSMASRVAVFSAGRLEQVDRPENIYERPETAFVASFVGGANVLPAPLTAALAGMSGAASLRPERIRIHRGADRLSSELLRLDAIVSEIAYFGAARRVVAHTQDGTRIAVTIPASEPCEAEIGTPVVLTFPAGSLHSLRVP